MYSRKSVEPRIKPWGTSTLTGYACKDFPSATYRSRLLLRKDKIRPNTQPEISYNFILWKRPAWHTLSKV